MVPSFEKGMEPDNPLNADPPGQVRIDWLGLANQLGGLQDAADGDARRLHVFVDSRRRWWSRDRNRTQDADERVWAYAVNGDGRGCKPIVFLKHRDIFGNSVGGDQPAGVKGTRINLTTLAASGGGVGGVGGRSGGASNKLRN